MTTLPTLSPWTCGYCRSGNHHLCRSSIDRPGGQPPLRCVCSHAWPEAHPDAGEAAGPRPVPLIDVLTADAAAEAAVRLRAILARPCVNGGDLDVDDVRAILYAAERWAKPNPG